MERSGPLRYFKGLGRVSFSCLLWSLLLPGEEMNLQEGRISEKAGDLQWTDRQLKPSVKEQNPAS